jgi:predicted site-specific integrase-resolvase
MPVVTRQMKRVYNSVIENANRQKIIERVFDEINWEVPVQKRVLENRSIIIDEESYRIIKSLFPKTHSHDVQIVNEMNIYSLYQYYALTINTNASLVKAPFYQRHLFKNILENTRIHLLNNQNDKNNLQEDMLENYKRFSQQLYDSLIVMQTLLYKIIHNSCIDVLRDEKCKDPELKNKIIIKMLEEYVPDFVNEASKQINHFQTI